MKIKNLPRINLTEVLIRLTTAKGLYFFFDRRTDELVYVGLAVGSGGFKRRIVTQHLNSSYIEYRSEKHSSQDEFQLKHAILKIGKNGELKKGIDKSAFRRSIGRKLQLRPGQETVEYITKNLYVRILQSEDIEHIMQLEKQLIARHQPVFNITPK